MVIHQIEEISIASIPRSGSYPKVLQGIVREISLESDETFQHLLACPLPFWKRVIDIVGACVGLVLFSPLFFLIGILIKLTSRGTIFFKQERTGYLGKPFQIYKFRSMRDDADETEHEEYVKSLIGRDKRDTAAMKKIDHDKRVTLLGRVLRKTSLDELPQLINVLRGNMTLIGPRPPIPYEVDEYETWHLQRFETVPGITGLWQVSGKNDTTFDQMVRMDLKYMRHLSPLSDMKIMLKTIPTVLSITIGTDSQGCGREG